MDIPEALDFTRQNPRAVLATRRRDGGVQLTPVLLAVDDDGSLMISTRETAVKTANLRREPYAWLCILNPGFFGDWVQLEGPVTLESLPGSMEALVRYYRLISGEHPDWDEYRAAMEHDRRLIVRVRPQRAGPNRLG